MQWLLASGRIVVIRCKGHVNWNAELKRDLEFIAALHNHADALLDAAFPGAML